jgi:hypothetical protein
VGLEGDRDHQVQGAAEDRTACQPLAWLWSGQPGGMSSCELGAMEHGGEFSGSAAVEAKLRRRGRVVNWSRGVEWGVEFISTTTCAFDGSHSAAGQTEMWHKECRSEPCIECSTLQCTIWMPSTARVIGVAGMPSSCHGKSLELSFLWRWWTSTQTHLHASSCYACCHDTLPLRPVQPVLH